MSDDYTRGYEGAPPGPNADMAEYQRGRSDQVAGRIDLAHRGGDTTKTYEANIEVGKVWVQNPNKVLNRMLLLLLGATVVFGLIGFALASFLGPKWTPSPTAWAIQFATVAFWLTGAIIWAQMLGGMLGRRTRRTVVVWLVLSLVLGVMLWGFLGPIIRGWTS